MCGGVLMQDDNSSPQASQRKLADILFPSVLLTMRMPPSSLVRVVLCSVPWCCLLSKVDGRGFACLTINNRVLFLTIGAGFEILTEADAIQLQLGAVLGEKKESTSLDDNDFEEMAP